MASKMLTIRINSDLIEEIDKAVEENSFSSRAEFLKYAARKSIEEQRKIKALELLKKNFGRGKRKGTRAPTEKEFERIREEIGKEILKKYNLK